MSNEAKKNPPVAKLQVGRVRATIWANVTDKGTFFSAKYQNGYKGRDGKWKNGDSYDLEGNLALHHATAWATAKLIELRAADTADTAAGDPEDQIQV